MKASRHQKAIEDEIAKINHQIERLQGQIDTLVACHKSAKEKLEMLERLLVAGSDKFKPEPGPEPKFDPDTLEELE